MSKTSMKKNISKIAFFFSFYNSLLSYSFLLFFYTHTHRWNESWNNFRDYKGNFEGIWVGDMVVFFQKATTLLSKKHVFFAFRKCGVCFKRMVP